uniref:Uncharacterized protein n=1 Tax=Anser cygnoides TaxID=8845 RepID=A0A8B9E1U7_ANSCY
MARQEGQLLFLGERSRGKTSCNQRRQRDELSKAECVLLNSGGHGIGLDIEQCLRECIVCTETGKYFMKMQQQSHFLYVIKMQSCGGPEPHRGLQLPHEGQAPICSL